MQHCTPQGGPMETYQNRIFLLLFRCMVPSHQTFNHFFCCFPWTVGLHAHLDFFFCTQCEGPPGRTFFFHGMMRRHFVVCLGASCQNLETCSLGLPSHGTGRSVGFHFRGPCVPQICTKRIWQISTPPSSFLAFWGRSLRSKSSWLCQCRDGVCSLFTQDCTGIAKTPWVVGGQGHPILVGVGSPTHLLLKGSQYSPPPRVGLDCS